MPSSNAYREQASALILREDGFPQAWGSHAGLWNEGQGWREDAPADHGVEPVIGDVSAGATGPDRGRSRRRTAPTLQRARRPRPGGVSGRRAYRQGDILQCHLHPPHIWGQDRRGAELGNGRSNTDGAASGAREDGGFAVQALYGYCEQEGI